jgi:Bacterial Ig-like domain (group 3)
MIQFKLSRFLAMIAIMAGCMCSQAQNHVEYMQQVQSAEAQLSLSSNRNPSNIGDGTAVVIKVSGSGLLAPSGTITFSAVPVNIVTATTVVSAPVALNSSGNADWVFNLAPGTYQIFATYSGDSDYQPSHSNPLTQTVLGPADFTLTLDSGPLTVKQGSTWNGSITATSVNNFNGTVTLTCSGGSSVAGVSCVQGKPLTLSAGGSAQFPIQVTTAATSLNVISSSVFMMGFGLASKRRRQKQMTTLSLLCLLLLIAGCGGIRYEQTDGTPRGDYKMNFTGQSGSLSHAVSFVVSVQ